MITSHTYTSSHIGPRILILGSIHGNEPCGTIAINRLIHEIEMGSIKLLQGSISCIPICNPQAHAKNVRHIDQNLNRVFCHHDNPTTYEQHIANALIAKIQSIAYDILIDCHSGYTLNAHFVFQDHDDDDSKKLAQATGMDTIIHEWPTLYDGSDDIDTGRYAHTQGKTAITIEGGQHEELQAITRTYNAIINILQNYMMISGDPYIAPHQQHIYMYALIKKEKAGHFVRHFLHGDGIALGECIIQYDDGSVYRADRDCIIILPKHYITHIGQERFYLGERR